MQQFPLLLLMVLLVSCSACETDLTTGEVVVDDTTVVNDPASETAFSSLAVTALDLVNQTRLAGCTCGTKRMPPVAPLRLHQQLVAAAQDHAEDQAEMQEMAHRGSDGSTVGTRLTRAGFNWRAVAENVAWNYPDVAAVTEAWFSSSGHCRNLMNPDYTFFGIGEEDRYWTQVFAR